MTNLTETFWDRIDDVQAGMLAANGEHPVPMSPQADRDEKTIWFITAAGAAAHRAAQSGGKASFYVADSKAQLYASVAGTLEAVNDPEKLDELWSVVAGAWFEDGRDDEAVRLIRFTPREAEIWATDGAAGFLYEIAKAHVSDSKPDMGEHGRITF